MNSDNAAELTIGIVTALVIMVVVWKFNKRNTKGNFDERQEIIRGRGYKYATFTILGFLVADLLGERFGIFETCPVGRELVILFMILAGVMVYALYCIKKDSYFGVDSDSRTYRAIMWVVIVCNAFSGIGDLKNEAFVDGKLAFGPWASVMLAVAFTIIMIALYVKHWGEEEEESADEES